jgi:hypothetical protein
MLLLCKLVRDSERKCTPITRANQGKGKNQGNILEYRMEELGPLTVLLMLLLLGPCVITSSPGSFETDESRQIAVSEAISKTAPR